MSTDDVTPVPRKRANGRKPAAASKVTASARKPAADAAMQPKAPSAGATAAPTVNPPKKPRKASPSAKAPPKQARSEISRNGDRLESGAAARPDAHPAKTPPAGSDAAVVASPDATSPTISSRPQRKRSGSRRKKAQRVADHDNASGAQSVETPPESIAPTKPAPVAVIPALDVISELAPASRAAKPTLAASTTPTANVLLSTRLNVRWGDMDAFNHVNNARFLVYLEEARLNWLQGLPGPWLDDNIAPVLAAALVNYRRPIEWPSTLLIELSAERVGSSSLTMGHRIIDATDPQITYSDGHVVMVWIDRRSGKPSPLPAAVRTACMDATG